MDAPVSDFLRSKFRQAHKFMDVDGDGILTRDDYAAITNYVAKKTGASEEEAAKSRQQWLKYFEILQPDPSIIVDEDRFTRGCEEMYHNGRKNFEKDLYETGSDMFDRLDLDGNGLITLEEFTIFYEAMGCFDPQLTLSNFNAIDTDSNGAIERKEFVDDFIRYWSDPDLKTGQAYLFRLLGEKSKPSK